MYFVLVVQYFQTEPYPKTNTVQFIGWWITFRIMYCLDFFHCPPFKVKLKQQFGDRIGLLPQSIWSRSFALFFLLSLGTSPVHKMVGFKLILNTH